MDFQDTKEETQFRAEARAWLEQNATPKNPEPKDSEHKGGMDGGVDIADARAWQGKIFDAGWACITWPREYGGRGGTAMEHIIWTQEVGNFAEPDGFFVIGIGMCGPTLMHFASDEQRKQLLPRMASGKDVWCQLFSEPGAGSDLAAISTRAELHGDTWRINGQKIWTSGAHYSDYGILLCRTDTKVPKHKGMTMFFIDMRQPGVEARPIHQADDGRHFNEVFFNDAEIPDAQRLGEVGAGWKTALLVLMNERLAVSDTQSCGFEELLGLAREHQLDGQPALRHPMVRQRLADWYLIDAGLRHLNSRMLSAISHGETPGPEASVIKLTKAALFQEINRYSMSLLGPTAAVIGAEGEFARMTRGGFFAKSVLSAPGARVAGGSDEIMRNIVAEQVLGLPPGPRPDKGVPFDQMPR